MRKLSPSQVPPREIIQLMGKESFRVFNNKFDLNKMTESYNNLLGF